MIDDQHNLPQTEARIDVQEWNEQAQGDTRGIFRVTNTVGFTYSNDVLSLGDPFLFTMPNPEGENKTHFQRGAPVKFYLSNKAVNDGAPTLKHTGIVVNRTLRGDQSGNFLDVQCADLGWHLRENDGPYWFKLQGFEYNIRLDSLLLNPAFIDPSWGIDLSQIRTSNEISNLIRQGLADITSVLGGGLSSATQRSISSDLNGGRAGAEFEIQALPTFIYIQVEPGDKVADIVLPYARRENLLFTVSPDGFMQLWRPDYGQRPLYEINLRKQDDPDRNKGNVISYSITEDLSTIYSDVTCIGEFLGNDLPPDPTNQNALKEEYVGVFQANNPIGAVGGVASGIAQALNVNLTTSGVIANGQEGVRILPFVHRKVFSDGDIFQQDFAVSQAEWAWRRGMFDAWSATYVVRGHHSNGRWWEADTMVTVRDTINGLDGNYYISAVTYTRSAGQGDLTQITIRKPGLLSAAGGVYPRYSLQGAPQSDIYATYDTVSTVTAVKAK